MKLCHDCSASIPKGTYCKNCGNARRRASRAARAEVGLCTTCGESNDTETKTCSACKQRVKETKYILAGTPCCTCGKNPRTEYEARCTECLNTKHRKYWKYRRLEVLANYGNKCVCCGETEKMFLAIDHINVGGAKHRKEIGATQIVKWLHKHNFPEGFQILCHNCNHGKHLNEGICPHTTTGSTHGQSR